MKMTNFLWVVLWVRGVSKTHKLLIKFGKIKQSHFAQLHHFQGTSKKPPRGGFLYLKTIYLLRHNLYLC